MKFTSGPTLQGDTPREYDDRFERQPTRLVIAASAGRHIDILRALSELVTGPFWILYVLALSRTGEHEVGRYQSPIPLERALTHTLLERYRGFLEGDARHSIWLHSPAEESTLVYDRHDLIFAYGPLDRFADALRSRSFSEREVRVPTPHSHHYHPQFDASERAILEHLEWRRSPLQPSDEEE